jgi:[acyl-carrier-protein] S-malonyltransferase
MRWMCSKIHKKWPVALPPKPHLGSKKLSPNKLSSPKPRKFGLISGIDGAPVLRVEDGLCKLALQIQQTIDWAACMDACRAARPQRVLELGPGDALARMIGEAKPRLHARSVAAFRSLDGIRHWLNAAA